MKKLLMVIDMQNDFVDGALGTKEAQEIIDNVCNKIKYWDGDIVYTLDTHGNDYYHIIEGKYLPITHCVRGTKGWEINDRVLFQLNKKKVLKIFEKNQFSSKEIFKFLVKNKYDEIQLIGLCTDICVLSNAVIARTAQLDTQIIVDASCCRGVTPENHEAALKVLRSVQVKVINE